MKFHTDTGKEANHSQPLLLLLLRRLCLQLIIPILMRRVLLNDLSRLCFLSLIQSADTSLRLHKISLAHSLTNVLFFCTKLKAFSLKKDAAFFSVTVIMYYRARTHLSFVEQSSTGVLCILICMIGFGESLPVEFSYITFLLF